MVLRTSTLLISHADYSKSLEETGYNKTRIKCERWVLSELRAVFFTLSLCLLFLAFLPLPFTTLPALFCVSSIAQLCLFAAAPSFLNPPVHFLFNSLSPTKLLQAVQLLANLYQGDIQLETQKEHQIFWLRVFLAFLITFSEFLSDPRQLLSLQFPVHLLLPP
jgi:hypothetical protein